MFEPASPERRTGLSETDIALQTFMTIEAQGANGRCQVRDRDGAMTEMGLPFAASFRTAATRRKRTFQVLPSLSRSGFRAVLPTRALPADRLHLVRRRRERGQRAKANDT